MTVQALPEDVLAVVLGRLAPRDLAASRCACKAWQAVVDGHGLLRAELLPTSVGGIFVEFNMLRDTEFFSCPATAATSLTGDLSYTSCGISVMDHCNGLVLLHKGVANPATRQWAQMPRKPPPRMGQGSVYEEPYLVFDPATSPRHYEVVLVPRVPYWSNLAGSSESEWPPASYDTHVYSSRTGRWEERTFVREGGAAGTVADILGSRTGNKLPGAYWRGALYVHCQTDFFCKITMSDSYGYHKYQVIKPPPGLMDPPEELPEIHAPPEIHLGRSKNGVYCTMVDGNFRLRVWILQESSGHQQHNEAEWVLWHENDLEHLLTTQEERRQQQDNKSCSKWALENISYRKYMEEFEQDEDGGYDPDEEQEHPIRHSFLSILGLHPFQETVFLNSTLERGLAYDLDTSTLRDLGHMRPKYYSAIAGQHACLGPSFTYTPCWMEDPLPKSSY